MFEIFSPIRDLLTARNNEEARIDNLAFRLHTRLSVFLFVCCAALVSAKQFFGEPITCITSTNGLEAEPVNAYCWVYSTFTVKRHLKGIVGRQVAAPGVAQATDSDEIFQHKYYQWVCVILIIQALSYYAPGVVWRAWEGGLLAHLKMELGSVHYTSEVWTSELKERIGDYFKEARSVGAHEIYALRFAALEVVNLVITSSQIYLLDLLLGGQFARYGPSVTGYLAANKATSKQRGSSVSIDPMNRIFPKLAKCTIHTFGYTGSSQTHDALCILSLNVVNEKVFILVWFWLIFLIVAASIAITYRVIVMTSPSARTFLLRASTRGSLDQSAAQSLSKNISYGDWFILRRLAGNLSPPVYRRFLADLAQTYVKQPI